MQVQTVALIHPPLGQTSCYSSPPVFPGFSKSSDLYDGGRCMPPSSDLGFTLKPQPVASCITPPGRLKDNSRLMLPLRSACLQEAPHERLDFGSGGMSFLNAQDDSKSFIFYLTLLLNIFLHFLALHVTFWKWRFYFFTQLGKSNGQGQTQSWCHTLYLQCKIDKNLQPHMLLGGGGRKNVLV